MCQQRSYQVAAASSAATGFVTIVPGIAIPNGFPSSASGGREVASGTGTGLTLAMVLVGTPSLLSPRIAHALRRRPRHACERHAGQIHFVLTDVVMPEMSGGHA